MAHLWTLTKDGWQARTLVARDAGLSPDAHGLLEVVTPSDAANRPGVLLRAPADPARPWLLLAAPDVPVRVNAVEVPAGLRVLAHRDALQINGCPPAFLSTEDPPAIATMPDAGREVYCPRCKQALAVGAAAVCCPACHTWHHQDERLGCWTYTPTCALCEQRSALDDTPAWSPADL